MPCRHADMAGIHLPATSLRGQSTFPVWGATSAIARIHVWHFISRIDVPPTLLTSPISATLVPLPRERHNHKESTTSRINHSWKISESCDDSGAYKVLRRHELRHESFIRLSVLIKHNDETFGVKEFHRLIVVSSFESTVISVFHRFPTRCRFLRECHRVL